MPCSCGNPAPHHVMRRKTFDGAAVIMWDNGAITGPMGFALPGVVLARPKTFEQITHTRNAGFMFMDNVELYDTNELSAFYKACRQAAKKNLPVAHGPRKITPILFPNWTLVETDRDGTPVERYWRLPRLQWPGLSVWDYCGTRNRSGGRYEILTVDHDDVCRPTGMRFFTLESLAKYLFSLV